MFQILFLQDQKECTILQDQEANARDKGNQMEIAWLPIILLTIASPRGGGSKAVLRIIARLEMPRYDAVRNVEGSPL